MKRRLFLSRLAVASSAVVTLSVVGVGAAESDVALIGGLERALELLAAVQAERKVPE